MLRAATTVGWGPRPRARSRRSPRRDGQLVQRGQVGGLGRGERIYAVRFIGDVGYVVTFRQTDPLYTVDLADPDRPRVVGELKIPGYSAYLHPVGDDLLLGVGPGGDRRRPRPGPPALALRRLRPRAAGAAAEGAARRALLELRGRVGPPRVPLVAGDEARAAADRQRAASPARPASASTARAGSRRSAASRHAPARLDAADQPRGRRRRPPVHGLDLGVKASGLDELRATRLGRVPAAARSRRSLRRGPIPLRERRRAACAASRRCRARPCAGAPCPRASAGSRRSRRRAVRRAPAPGAAPRGARRRDALQRLAQLGGSARFAVARAAPRGSRARSARRSARRTAPTAATPSRRRRRRRPGPCATPARASACARPASGRPARTAA